MEKMLRLGKYEHYKGNYYEVISGLKENDKVVTEGNFLIDSESRLRGSAQEEHRH